MLQITKVSGSEAAIEIIRVLFREYAAELQENLCFQSFDAEVYDPLKKYGPPTGMLLLAYWEESPAGCIALQPLKEAGVCEMKRLYVRPAFRTFGIGRQLVQQLLQEAQQLQYQRMRLDTLDRLQPAIRLYEQFGFTTITAYYKNPLPGVVYMEKKMF